MRASTGDAPRQVVNFNSDWRFAKGEQQGAEAPQFDDSGWTPVRLPHDWAIAGPFDPQAPGASGKLPWQGVGWYRKTFTIGAADDGKQVYLDFDGVMAFPKVYVNGHLAGGWDYGYMSFRVDATPYVKFGEPNTVAVQVDTRQHGTRWYPGAGIYRKVTLVINNPVHIAHWGTFITTPEVTDEEATINVRTTVENHSQKEVTVGVVSGIRGPTGKSHGSSANTVTVPAGGSKDVETGMSLLKPERWDIDHPALYTVENAIVPAEELKKKEMSEAHYLDRVTVPFGIRTFEFTADDGFHLNGRRLQLHGVCLHHDQGPLGGAFFTRAMERQLEIMREIGVNAIRTSHNPPAPELLDLCDRMGFVVWDECFDKWDDKADRVDGRPPLEQYGEKQIRNLVLRDRNHPSVVVWSIGNEIGAGGEGVTPERIQFMSDFVRKYDPTRPVGMACHIPEQAYTPMFDALDLTGWNYRRRYGVYHDRNPDKPIIYSESASALSTRGFYELPLPTAKTDFSDQLQVNSYDMNAAPWSDIADKEFDLMERDKFVAGEFVWTGFDYLGEPTPFDQDARSSYFGIVDLVGIPKDRYWLYRSYWRPDETTVHILPHWNWPDRVGQNVPVFVYTNGDSAELFLNGKSLGRRTKNVGSVESASATYYSVMDKYRLRWMDVVYEPGELKAVAYKDGKQIGEAVMRTAGPPAALRLSADRSQLEASGDDLCYVLVEAVDAEGNPCPLADNLVRFHVDGPADIAGVGNGNPMSFEAFQADHHKLFFGKAMLILRTEAGRGGDIRVTAESDSLKPAAITVRSRPDSEPE